MFLGSPDCSNLDQTPLAPSVHPRSISWTSGQVWPDGSSYEGSWNAGALHGQGRFDSRFDGGRYMQGETVSVVSHLDVDALSAQSEPLGRIGVNPN